MGFEIWTPNSGYKYCLTAHHLKSKKCWPSPARRTLITLQFWKAILSCQFLRPRTHFTWPDVFIDKESGYIHVMYELHDCFLVCNMKLQMEFCTGFWQGPLSCASKSLESWWWSAGTWNSTAAEEVMFQNWQPSVQDLYWGNTWNTT